MQTQLSTTRATSEIVLEQDRAHLFYPWSAQRDADRRIGVLAAEGSYFWDYDGRRYLDFASQFVHVNLGHQHPKLIAAIQRQADILCTVSPAMINDQRAQAATLIAERAPGDLDHVLFTTGGAEANEHAIRMARLVTGRPKILAAYRSYHGATNTTLGVSGDARRWPMDTGMAGVARFFPPYLYRSAFSATNEEEECQRALAHLEQVIQLEGAGTIAGIIIEPVLGTNGVIVPPTGYLLGVRQLCNNYDLLLICDEVMAGFGRTGQWFAVQNWDVTPDLLTFAKGVNSGYVPLGGVLIGDRVVAHFTDRAYPGGSTYSGHPLACAAAVAAITIMTEERVVENAADIGARVLGPQLYELARRHRSVGDVRGLGVFWALELVSDPAARTPLVARQAPGSHRNDPMAELVAHCHASGLWPFTSMNRVHVVPPCVITEDEARAGLQILDEALDLTDRYCR
jgi:taurine--2-oxoglutarate transaminase